ncbi:MAG: hypothetical protein IT244_13885 [Bacteroidia bacterium]|nr:hypothetical protein [Bacteroidia bacterium]
MKQKIQYFNRLAVVIFAASIHIFGSCNETVKSAETTNNSDSISGEEPTVKEVAFQIANGYFLKNNVPDSLLNNPKIETQEMFDKLFGMATVMGENGKPTAINFDTHFAIAVALPETDKATILAPDNIISDGSNMTFNYKIRVGQQSTATIKPLLIVIVDKQNTGNVTAKGSTN